VHKPTDRPGLGDAFTDPWRPERRSKPWTTVVVEPEAGLIALRSRVRKYPALP